ncbi:MAG: cytochrome P450 [Streptosporangiales bacterium]|nr:cytochrome P450 [Streptosporangiales bacterium]
MTISDDWVEHHFDHLAPEVAPDLHAVLARTRARCPVARSDAHEGGFWVMTRYADVLKAAQDWETWSSELGMTVPFEPAPVKILPVAVDPPLQKEFKRLVNAHFTKTKVAPWEEATRALVNELIDSFIERGECDFMAEFARPLPGRAFFDLALHAPSDDLDQVNEWAVQASLPKSDKQQDSLMQLAGWIYNLIERRKADGPRGDVVDEVMAAEIEGRPIDIGEAIGTIHLLILGGLETTAGVLGAAMLQFCEHPEILEEIRRNPDRIAAVVEELLRLDGSFVCIGRTARHDTEIGGRAVAEGERALLYWASANRDEAEFDRPDEFDPGRERNRHLAFGAGPHKCVGSNLARMNLRVALEEIARRLHDVKLQPGAEIGWHSSFNRAPLSVPITFTPGPRLG